MLTIYVDADGCPVKEEVYRVADRYQLSVFVVSNAFMRVPGGARYRFVRVGVDFDAVDDWIAEHIKAGDLAITTDIQLAARCLKRGARALAPKGHEFSEDNIGEALASRELSEELRQMGLHTGGPAPFAKKDRSRFLQQMDVIVNSIRG